MSKPKSKKPQITTIFVSGLPDGKTRNDLKTRRSKPKYDVGDIVGVAANALYEYEILDAYDPTIDVYAAKCLKSCMDDVKVGDSYAIAGKQIIVKLGSDGKKWEV